MGDYRVKLFQNELCTQGKTIVELLKYVCRWDLFYNEILVPTIFIIIILLNLERVTHGSFSIHIFFSAWTSKFSEVLYTHNGKGIEEIDIFYSDKVFVRRLDLLGLEPTCLESQWSSGSCQKERLVGYVILCSTTCHATSITFYIKFMLEFSLPGSAMLYCVCVAASIWLKNIS